MAVHYETEPNGEKALVIDSFDGGISDSPYTGINSLTQVDISVPGEISVGYPITKATISSGTLGNPIHRATQYVLGSATQYYILDDTSQVFKSSTIGGPWGFLSSSNTTTGGTANNQGLAFWSPPSGGTGYLFKFRDSHIDYLAGGSGSWVTGWNPADGSTTASATIQGSTTHYALVGQDGVLYFCNGVGVGSIIENAGETFDPTDTTTYTFAGLPTAPNALQLPPYDAVQSLAEQGINLLAGGSQNAIYPWDRVSHTFSYPLFIADAYIKRMVTVNTNVYIFPGNVNSRGRIYVSNGSNANLFFKIPDYLFGENDPYYIWGDAMWHRNNLVFGFFVVQNSGSGVINSEEIWALDLSVNQYGTSTESGFRSISTIPNLQTFAASPTVLISDASNTHSNGFGYIVGWNDGSTAPGIGYSGTVAGIGSYSAISDLIPVGTLYQVKTFTQVEFKLRSPLASGEQIQLTALTDKGLSLIGTTSFAGSGAVISDVYPVSFEKAQWLRILVGATGNSANSGVRLKEVRLR